MVEVFCKELISNFSKYFKEKYKQDNYPNQDGASCKFLIDKCKEIKPDYVLDIGTNFGASTLSLAYALKQMGKNLSCLTTVDKYTESWNKVTPVIQKDILEKYSIDVNEINSVQSDFDLLSSSGMIKPKSKYFIFYDIHDNTKTSFIRKFLDAWYPRIDRGFIGFHDISVVQDNYILPENADPDYPRIVASYFKGGKVSGFLECLGLMEWANQNKKDFYFVEKTSIGYMIK